jgi:hypothetical protein
MHRVKALGFRLSELQHSSCDDFEPGFLKTRVNLADQVFLYAIGFDDGERLLNGHGASSVENMSGKP